MVRVLTIDIGAGTQDILLYDSNKTLETCVKMVLPSPTLVYAKKVKEATKLGKDLFISGEIIGGGAFSQALKSHMRSGHRAIMTKKAAYTIRNNLNEVEEMGIELTEDETVPANFRGSVIKTEEVDLAMLAGFLIGFDEDIEDADAVAVAVQDHGVSPKDMCDREFRFIEFQDILKRDPKPESFAFFENEIPSHHLRMKSAANTIKRYLPDTQIIVMDTSPAAILGCLKDPKIDRLEPLLLVNVGNCHTMGAIISEGNIDGLFEHHTTMVPPTKLETLITRFSDGNLRNDEVLSTHGHGVFLIKAPKFVNLKMIVATGPNRSILNRTNLRFHLAAPAGDVMMTGPMGLVEVALRKLK